MINNNKLFYSNNIINNKTINKNNYKNTKEKNNLKNNKKNILNSLYEIEYFLNNLDKAFKYVHIYKILK